MQSAGMSSLTAVARAPVPTIAISTGGCAGTRTRKAMRSSTSARAFPGWFPHFTRPAMVSSLESGSCVELRKVTVRVAHRWVGNVTTAVRKVSRPNCTLRRERKTREADGLRRRSGSDEACADLRAERARAFRAIGAVGLSDKMCVCYRRVAGLDVAFLDAD